MASRAVAICSPGLVVSVGLSAPAACAAIRTKLANPTKTAFLDSMGQMILAHQVPLDKPVRGVVKLACMAAMAIEECLSEVPREKWDGIALLLCVAEPERAGRPAELEERLLQEIRQALSTPFSTDSAVVAQGKVGVAVALAHARRLIHERGASRVVIATTDSLVNWPTLSRHDHDRRLLTAANSNGFMAGEGAGACLVTRVDDARGLICNGIGFGVEAAHIESGEPLRADGLTTAVKAALQEAGCELHDIACRIADLSGEQYYFKEASLALNRILRQRVEDRIPVWHPAESVGETGATAGMVCLATAHAARTKAYAPGPSTLVHLANDSGARAAIAIMHG